MTESEFWGLVKRHVPPEAHATRIESSTSSGASDVSICLGGREAWLELKVAHGSRVYFRTAQRAWILERTRAGGTVLVLVRVDEDTIGLYDAGAVLAVPRASVKEGNAFSISLLDFPAPLFTTAKPFDWPGLFRAMFPPGWTNSKPAKHTEVI